MGLVKSCCQRSMDDKLVITKMDLSHCGCMEVPNVVFNAERCIETLILASNQISSLPPQLFHCQFWSYTNSQQTDYKFICQHRKKKLCPVFLSLLTYFSKIFGIDISNEEMKHLNLNDNCLSNIPPAISSFLNLVSLKLDKNNLQELPEDLKMCKKLKRLSLSSNPWKQVPNVVTQLISLEELYMNDCELHYLPASVGRLSKLKILELRNNNLCNLPLSMRRLESLNRLDISDNEFNEFSACIPKLKSLKELLIDNNEIEEIVDIKNLVHLEHFDASYNHILKVSETIGCCIHLIMLNLSFNYIEQLPNSIGNITYLQTLQLEMNELTEIPKSIGKLSYLEELNLCNNKLHTLPSTIGLLRNLRNINVSRNIIEEFPPDIGSCSKLGIINAAYNRLRVLPSEVGYLNNLKVLDLVGNFLMYLPITIINLRGIRAIWLSANQNVPLIPFTEDINIASGERFLTNIALPQLGEIADCNPMDEKVVNEKPSTWSKKISFAEDDDLLPGKLHRTPTPFPKELRAPNRKQKNEEPKRNDNYVNVIDGKVSEQEPSLYSPSCVPTPNDSHDISDGFGSQIKEANIRRKNRDLSFEVISLNQSDNGVKFMEVEYSHEANTGGCKVEKEEVDISERQRMNTPVLKEDFLPSSLPQCNVNSSQRKNASSSNTSSPCLSHRIRGSGRIENSKYPKEELESKYNPPPDVESSNGIINGPYRQQVIYSNLVNDVASGGNNGNEDKSGGEISSISPQRIREMYHNDIIYGSVKNSGFRTVESRAYCNSDFINGNVENPPKHLYSNNPPSMEHSFVHVNNINKEVCKTIHRESPLPPLPPPDASKPKIVETGANTQTQTANSSLSPEPPLSKEDFISIAEQMKNRNIAPPCYEIAKMYSTKAALFENNRMDQLKSK